MEETQLAFRRRSQTKMVGPALGGVVMSVSSQTSFDSSGPPFFADPTGGLPVFCPTRPAKMTPRPARRGGPELLPRQDARGVAEDAPGPVGPRPIGPVRALGVLRSR